MRLAVVGDGLEECAECADCALCERAARLAARCALRHAANLAVYYWGRARRQTGRLGYPGPRMLVSESSPREQTSRFRRALRLGLLACIGVCVLIIAVVYTSTRGSNMHTSALPGHSDLRSTPAAQPTSEAASEDSSDCPLTYVRPSYRELKEHVVRPYVFGGPQRPFCVNCHTDQARPV